MKKVLALLLFFAVNYAFAQKFAGLYNADAGMGVFMYTPSTNQVSLSKPIPPSIGNPDAYWPSICQFEGKIYGRTPSDGASNFGTIYEYDPAANTFVSLYTFKENPPGGSRYELLADKSGLLYGVASDADGVDYLFELNPKTKAFKKYHPDQSIDIHNAHYLVIADNNKLYFVSGKTGADNYPVTTFIEFDLTSKTFVEKLTTKEIPAGGHMAWDVVSDIGGGKIAGTVNMQGFPPAVFIYDYITNKVVVHKLDGKLYYRTGGAALRSGTDLYVMVSPNKKNTFGSVLKISLTTGAYEEVAEFSKLGIYNPAASCLVNDVLYGYVSGDKIISCDLKTKKVSIVRSLKEDGFDAYSGYILVK